MSDRPDFPFYAAPPVGLDGRGWLIVMAAQALAFAALIGVPIYDFPQNLIPALLFLAIPLVALRSVAGARWTALFRPVEWRQIGQMVIFGLLTLGASLAIGLILTKYFTFSQNPQLEAIGRMSGGALVRMMIPTLPQLIGEELLGILPFLAVLWLCVTRLGLPRLVGIVAALLASALIFGAAHLPTYDWNWGQALLGIGTARIVLTLAYVATRNLWVAAGAHILNDWTSFLFAFALGHAQFGTAS